LAIYRNQYWKRKGIDGPRLLPFFGSLLQLINPNNPPVLVINEWTQRYGRIFGYQHGWKNVLVLSDPELVHEVLVNKFDCFGERRVSVF
jgi:predicted metallopeptidase